jgi:hypothetical protein
MSKIKCPNCGNENESNSAFCLFCGASIEPAPKKDIKDIVAKIKPIFDKAVGFVKKNIIKIAVPAGVIVIGAVVLIIILGSMSIYITEGPGVFYGEYSETEIVIRDLSGEDTSLSYDSSKLRVRDSLPPESSSAFLVGEDGNELYYVGKNVVKIADDVLAFNLAVDGKAVAFFEGTDEDDCRLGIWTTDGKIKYIADDVSTDFSVISPDGKTVIYKENTDETAMVYMYNGTKTIELGKETAINPLAVTNGGNYIYYTKDDTLYVQKGSDIDTRVKLGSKSSTGYFNIDMTEFIYNDDGKTKITVKGGEPIKLTGDLSYMVLKSDTASIQLWSGVNIRSVKTFKNCCYRTSDEDIYYINNKYEVQKAASSIDYAIRAYDEKSLIYKKGDSIYQIDLTKKNAEPVTRVGDDVETVAGVDSKDGVYYKNTDGEIMYQKGTAKPVYILDSVDNAVIIADSLFIVSDKELYISNGKKATLVKGMSGFEVESIQDLGKNLVIGTTGDDGVDYYASSDGKKIIYFTTI